MNDIRAIRRIAMVWLMKEKKRRRPGRRMRESGDDVAGSFLADRNGD